MISNLFEEGTNDLSANLSNESSAWEIVKTKISNGLLLILKVSMILKIVSVFNDFRGVFQDKNINTACTSLEWQIPKSYRDRNCISSFTNFHYGGDLRDPMEENASDSMSKSYC